MYGDDEPVFDVDLDPASAAMEELILRATDEMMVYFSTYECVNHSHGGRCAVRSPLWYPQMSTDWTLNLAICDKITTTPTRFNRQSYLYIRSFITRVHTVNCCLVFQMTTTHITRRSVNPLTTTHEPPSYERCDHSLVTMASAVGVTLKYALCNDLLK